MLRAALELLPGAAGAARAEIAQAGADLARVDVTSLQQYDAYLASRGAPASMRGPDVQTLMSKSPQSWAQAKQHRPSTSPQGGPPLVDMGCGPDRHAEQALALPHPFRREPVLEIDLQYGIDCYASLGPQVRVVRRQRLGVLRAIAAAVEPIDRCLLARRHVRIDGAPGVRPMFAAMMIVLLDWPDRALPRRLANGFAIAGQIEPSGVLRPIEATTSGNSCARPGERLLGPDAEAFVDALVHDASVTPRTTAIFERTMEEVQAGLADPLRMREEMDEMSGKVDSDLSPDMSSTTAAPSTTGSGPGSIP